MDQKQRSCVEKELVRLEFQATERSVDGLEIEPTRIKLVAEPGDRGVCPTPSAGAAFPWPEPQASRAHPSVQEPRFP